ncbi:MAG TPA: M23 family metallopeptidase [Acidimicrobiales bacterium]|nr:M23 family metallopeptidase [Acidimicrobiales bacterium]
MPRFALSAFTRAQRAPLRSARAAASALLVASTVVAVVVTVRDAPAKEPVNYEAAAVVHAYDGLSAQVALAAAFDERLAAQRAAAAVVVVPEAPAPPPRASRSAARPRPPIPPPAPVVRAAATGPVVWPAAGPLSGTYGERRGGRGHLGIDIDGETGDPVWAAAKGVVSWAGPAPAGYSGYGTMILIDHADGVQTLYAHLSSLTIATGAAVEPGVQVGRIGTSGNVTGSHLHFEVRQHGVQTDPLAYLPPR